MIVTLSTPVGERLQRTRTIEDDFDFDGVLEDIIAEFRHTYNGAHLLGGCTITIEPAQ